VRGILRCMCASECITSAAALAMECRSAVHGGAPGSGKRGKPSSRRMWFSLAGSGWTAAHETACAHCAAFVPRSPPSAGVKENTGGGTVGSTKVGHVF